MVQQLTIFDALPTEAFEVGDMVEVRGNVARIGSEDYYYLQDYVGLTGRIVKVIREPVLQYEVEFVKKVRNGIIYHDELRRVSNV